MASGNRARKEALERAAERGRAGGEGFEAGAAFGPSRTVEARVKKSAHGRVVAALLAVLLAFACFYCAIPFLFPEEESELSESLLGISQEDIIGMAWEYDGKTTEVDFSDGSWKASGSEALLDQSSVESIAQTAASAEVDRSLSADSQTEGMGLDNPAIQASITFSDGSTVSFSIGATDDAGSAVYVKTSRSNAIALVDAGLLTAFATDITHLYEMEESPNASQVDKLSMTYGGESVTLTYCEGGSDASYTSEYEWFVGEGEGMKAADESAASAVTSAVNSLTWESCVDPDCDDAASYGLDDPLLTAAIDYTTQASVQTGETDDNGDPVYETQEQQGTYAIEVGDMTEDGAYYARPQGSSSVYTLDSDDVQALMNAVADPDYFATSDVCLMDWDTVDSVEISYDGEATTIELVREEADSSDDSSDEGSSDGESVTYRVNGDDADSTRVEALLSAIKGISAEGEADGAPGDEGFEISFTFRRNTETFSEMTLGFKKYDNNFYLVSFNGEERLLVNRNDVAELEELVEAL